MKIEKRDVQHTQESGLSVRAQLWTWAEAFSDSVWDATDAGISSRSGARDVGVIYFKRRGKNSVLNLLMGQDKGVV